MAQIELNRTFLFIDAMNSDRYPNNKPTACFKIPAPIGVTDTEEVGVLSNGPDGKPLELHEDPEEQQPHYSQIGRWGHFVSGKDGPGDSFTFEAMLFPDMDRKLKLVTWKGQNFAAFATDWETVNSPLINFSVRPALTPLVDVCGMVVGYFGQGISTEYLFATEEGEIYFTTHTAYRAHQVSARSINNHPVWLTPAGKILEAPIAQGMTVEQFAKSQKGKVLSGNMADILTDIDGFVIAINLKIVPPPEPERGNPLIAFLGFLLPPLHPHVISADCLPGGAREGSDECAEEMAEMLMDAMDWTFFLIDIISLGTSRVARKAATKLISLAVRRRGVMAVEELEHAGMAAAKALRTAEKIETLTLRAPEIQRIERAGEAIQEVTSSGKKAERMLAAGVSGKKKNISELSREAGMTNMAVRDIRQKMQKNGVRVRFRPAGDARKLRKRGAIPKWEELKMKTISEDDVLLGAPKDGLRKPGYFKPDLPNQALKSTDPAAYERLMKRYAQREEEFRQLAAKVKKYIEDGDIIVRDKVVYDGPTGKDIAGDYDIYEILDKNGNHIGPSDPRYNRILDDLRGRRIGAQHGAHVDWNPTDAFEIKIKDEIIQRHRTTTPLYEFREDGSVWKVFAD